MALKRIRMEFNNEGLPISSLREISILKRLNHENVVSVHDVVVGNGLEDIFMLMEYCEQDMATLMDRIIAEHQAMVFTVPQVKCLLKQLLRGTRYLHDSFIIHRDLKLSNLLLSKNGILKIADFGLARQFGDPIVPLTPKVVTLWYRSPELLLGANIYTCAVDLWYWF